MRSTYLSSRSNWVTSARSGLSMYWTASSGKPASSSASWIKPPPALMLLRSVRAAARMTALPVLRQRGGNVDGDVGPRLVNDAQHTDRDAAPAPGACRWQQPAQSRCLTGIQAVRLRFAYRPPGHGCASSSMSRSSMAGVSPLGRQPYLVHWRRRWWRHALPHRQSSSAPRFGIGECS